MATAKRVAQEPKRVGEVKRNTYKLVSVYELNGVEVSRDTIAEETEVSDTRKSVPQPDRILLDLSLEEALEVKRYLGRNNSSRGFNTYPVYQALDRLSLFPNPASPNQGTPTSPVKDANILKSPVQGKAFGEGYSPIGGGLSAVAAQRRAYEEYLFGDSPFGDNGR